MLGSGMTESVKVATMQVAAVLHHFIEREALPGSGVTSEAFWSGLERAVTEITPRWRVLLARRDELQSAINDYHQRAPGPVDVTAYEEFLRDVGYLVDEPAPFTVSTADVDTEITTQAGPQLVVPVTNAIERAYACTTRASSPSSRPR